MGLFKQFVATGSSYLKNGISDFKSWCKSMLDDQGPLIKPFLKDIRTWSLKTKAPGCNIRDMKKNCWEIKMCGRQEGGAYVAKSEICPVSKETKLNGIHNGKNGGRACWAVDDTLCSGKKDGTFAQKHIICRECEFYRIVRDEEGFDFISVRTLRKRLDK